MEDQSSQQTILIVDDEKTNIAILAELLRPDFKVRAATTGEKALEIAFSSNPPDLILLDVLMPGIDGYEVCKRLKSSAHTKSIPIIFITGKVSEEDEIYGFSLGAVEYITKPFRPIVVKVRVNTQAELKRHRDYLEGISYLDGLTGIPNRRKLNEYLLFYCDISHREKTPISMIMMDTDHFKLYNDHYGHQEGDTCLIRIAKALIEVPGDKADFAARFGGEEFACILPNKTQEEAVVIAEKLRLAVADLKIPHETSLVEPYVTISLGVASVIPSGDTTCKDLVRAADEALYRSKASGRNRVSI